MSEIILGKIIAGDARRDAVHVAIAPMVAAQALHPGDHVYLTPGRTDSCSPNVNGQLVGIVDPFLTQLVPEGCLFWLFLYPNSVTSLRHEWTHPVFAASPTENENEMDSPSRQWLEDFAKEVEMSFAELMDAARIYAETGEEVCLKFSLPECVYTDGSDFWEHYSAVTGKENVGVGMFFRCGC